MCARVNACQKGGRESGSQFWSRTLAMETAEIFLLQRFRPLFQVPLRVQSL
jgi:hypothetical protein